MIKNKSKKNKKKRWINKDSIFKGIAFFKGGIISADIQLWSQD